MKLRGKLRELKKLKVAQHRADVNIGKNGIHPGLVEEVRRRLELEGAVKIRILKNARQKVSEQDIMKLAEEVGAIVIDHRGYTFILAKRSLRTARR